MKTDIEAAAKRFSNLTFNDFKSLALDPSLSVHEKIGFPDEYRKGKEADIFRDIIEKLDFNTSKSSQILLDIGPGCTELPNMIHNYCEEHGCEVLLVDSKEMLDQLPNTKNRKKFEGAFPNEVGDLLESYQNKIDYIVCYSLLQCIFYNDCIYKFIDSAVSLLKPDGKLLVGDIPNISKRKRFFSSDTGIEFHKEFMKTDEPPKVNTFNLEPAQIDDGVLLGLVQRYRGFGFEAYILPQNSKLPMYNRREDLLIHKV